MQTLRILILAVLTTGSLSLRAQFTDKLVPHFGFMWEFATAEEAPEQTVVFEDFYNFNIGSYIALWHRNDVVSVGIDPSVQMGLNFILVPTSTGGARARINYTVQTPVFAMMRIGALATKYNEQGVGIGLGVGGNYTYFNQQIGINQRRMAGFVNPSAVAELTIRTRGNPLTGRLHFALDKTNSLLKINTNGVISEIQFPMGNFGFGLLYGF